MTVIKWYIYNLVVWKFGQKNVTLEQQDNWAYLNQKLSSTVTMLHKNITDMRVIKILLQYSLEMDWSSSG
jgi:hypothetical protein